LVYDDIAKSDHAQPTPEHWCIDDACLGKQHNALSRLFGGSQATASHDPIGVVESRFTGALDVDRDGILGKNILR
jgi:hypothetical protein